MRAEDFVLLRFNHYRVGFGQLGDLPPDDLFRRDAAQIVMALFALLDLDANPPIGIVDQFSDEPFMTEGRPALLLRTIGRLIALLIARRRLGRISRICRRLFEPLDFRSQMQILLFQALDFGNQGFD